MKTKRIQIEYTVRHDKRFCEGSNPDFSCDCLKGGDEPYCERFREKLEFREKNNKYRVPRGKACIDADG